MKKNIFWSLVAVLLGLGAWFWYISKSSNPWGAATVGDIPAPNGYTRVEAPAGSYARYLRSLPLKPRGTQVNLYTGGEANLQFLSAAVIDQDLLSNSEQCADATMRLRAEYLWSKGRYSDIAFRDVNGRTLRYSGGGSRKAFEKFMREVFGCCSTYSLYNETRERAIKDVQPGDVLVYPARPGHKYGHAVIVVDVARGSNGKVAIMCAQGNTPARDKHIVRNPYMWASNPWFILDESDEEINISIFHFNKNELRHY